MSPTLVAICGFLLLAVLHIAVPRVVVKARQRQLLAACRRRRAIVLSFDDGPSQLLTPLIVDRLDKAGVKGTFFVLGERVLGNERTVHALLRDGHEVGSHGHSHVHHFWSWPWVGVLDTRDGWRVLQETASQRPCDMAFRPPYGKLNLLSLLLILWRRAPIAMWTHDCGDARDSDKTLSGDVVDAVRRDGGGVVLLHDFDRVVATDNMQVLAKVDALLQLKREGFTFLRFSELLAPDPVPAIAEPVRAET